ncbi:Dynamin family protein [Arthrobacter crystallopoietes]|uniref:Dynamin family protein n=2 Tax=Crystallibacter crystallopoietes TaxID=37928 RepID=A0A1H1G353_9MICC|nr:Dynamin family protein [Arthrobacter crystallopoietes]
MMESVTGTTDGRAAQASDGLALAEEVRDALGELTLPLHLPGAAQARQDIHAALDQLEDYVLPRYRSLDAPLLAVVGGSTGAGKSTLVNALAGRPVTRTGAIRPTTRQPILLHNPRDRSWFADQRVLPALNRITSAAEPARALPAERAGADPDPRAMSSLVLVSESTIPPGIALLDAPDVDSISDDNRKLAGQLLSAADLWLFVTTANRYADAVPWKLLLEAAGRDILVAVVLDRVPAGVEDEVRADLAGLLEREGLGNARLFVVPESPLDELGMLPVAAVTDIRGWLLEISADAAGRAAIARRTLSGAVASLAATTASVADALDAQSVAAARLRDDVLDAYNGAARRTLDSTQDGTLLRGEVLARWQDFVGTGEFFRSIESGIGRLRDRIGAFFSGKPAPSVNVEAAIETGLQAVIVDEAAKGAEDADARWRNDPAGRQLLGSRDLSTVSDGFSDKASAEIRAWQGDLLEMIQTEGASKRLTARMLSFGVNGLGVALMVVVFAATGGLTGIEIGVAGGTAVVGQKLLEAVFGEDAVRRLARKAREELKLRTENLMREEATRFLSLIDDRDAAALAAGLRGQSTQLSELARRTGAEGAA